VSHSMHRIERIDFMASYFHYALPEALYERSSLQIMNSERRLNLRSVLLSCRAYLAHVRTSLIWA
jgi:hypothetical protein